MFKPQRGGGSGGFKGGGGFGDKKPWDRGGSGGGRGFDRPEMHKATCHDCGNTCEVPFRPNGSRPIFCSNCFKKDEGRDSRGFGGDSRRPSFDSKPSYRTENAAPQQNVDIYKEQFKTINAKLDAILKVLAPQIVHVIEKQAPVEAVKPASKKEETPVVEAEKPKKAAKKKAVAKKK